MTEKEYDQRVAVILPAYNEEDAIALTIKDFSNFLPNARYFLIDNNCTDKTVEKAAEAAQDLNLSFMVIREALRGKGNAIRKAFVQIDADLFVVVDADFTYPAEFVPKMIEKINLEGFSMVVGDRLTGGSYLLQNTRRLHNFGNNLITQAINVLFKANVKDVLSGYRVMTRDFVKNLPILGQGFELETEITIHALDKRFSLYEYPIDYRARPVGSFSKLNTFRDGTRVIRTVIRIFRDYKPLKFFMYIAAIPALTGLLAGLRPIMDYIETRYVTHVPLAILSAALEICALLIVAIGIILQNLSNTERRLSELARLRS